MADVATFRVVFPEFKTLAADEQITYWMGQAPFATPTTLDEFGAPCASPNRLGASYDLAIMLFAAHNIVLGLETAAAAAKGRAPGAPAAPLTSKGAGGLSASYDANIAATTGAGIYNATSYGQRLWKLLEIAAMGGLYTAPWPRPTVFPYGVNTRGLF